MKIFIVERIVAQFFGVASAILAFTGSTLFAAGSTVGAIASFAIAVTPLFCWFLLSRMARGYEHEARALIASEARPRWEIDSVTWSAYLDRCHASRWRLPLILGSVILLTGVGLGVTERSNDSAASSIPWWSLPLAGCGLAILTVAVFLLAAARIRVQRRLAPALFVMGPSSLYLTGTYRPFRHIYNSLLGATFDGTELTFRFYVGRGAVQDLKVPVPPTHRDEAQRLVSRPEGPA